MEEKVAGNASADAMQVDETEFENDEEECGSDVVDAGDFDSNRAPRQRMKRAGRLCGRDKKKGWMG